MAGGGLYPFPWIRDPKTRGAFNPQTGEKLSRRQFAKKILGRESFEEKAKKNKAANPEAAKARPAKGRKSTQQTRTKLAKKLKIRGGISDKSYDKWDAKLKRYGETSIWVKNFHFGPATTYDEIQEAMDITEFVKMQREYILSHAGVFGVLVQVFVRTTSNEVRPLSGSTALSGGVLYKVSSFPYNSLFDVIANGVSKGSDSGGVIVVRVRPYFEKARFEKNYADRKKQ